MIQSGVVRTKTAPQSPFSATSQRLETPSNHPYWFLHASTAECCNIFFSKVPINLVC